MNFIALLLLVFFFFSNDRIVIVGIFSEVLLCVLGLMRLGFVNFANYGEEKIYYRTVRARMMINLICYLQQSLAAAAADQAK